MSRWIAMIGVAAAIGGCSVGPGPALAANNVASLADAPQLTAAPAVAPDQPIRAKAAPDDAVSCRIRVSRTSNGVRFEPVVRFETVASGDYSLVITKTGAGGSSDIAQDGPIAGVQGKDVALSTAEISMEPGAGYKARLVIRVDGETVCRREIRS